MRKPSVDEGVAGGVDYTLSCQDETIIAPARNIVVIPARGASQGIARKNLRMVGGASLLGWSITAGLWIADPSDLVVSTEDREIAEEARRWGARVLKRPAELATDSAPTEPVIAHALEAIGAASTDLLVLLQPTSPLRRRATVTKTLAAVREEGYASALTVTAVHPFRWSSCGGIAQRLYERRQRRQDATPEFLETGSVYTTSVSAFWRSGERVSGDTKLIVVDPWQAVDIDEAADLELVDTLASHWSADERPGPPP